MPSFDIVKEIKPDKTFRASSVITAFDIDINATQEYFKGNIEIEGEKWNIGLIVGGSGTGKSTIAKEVFPDYYFEGYDYKADSIVDDMPKSKSIKEIEYIFTSVGFASPPSWLKPYRVLSNGERMRVDLARAILEEKEMIVFDEFTSVVDREVAKTSSYAISKAIKKRGGKFVAVACHKDIIDWLEPDWIYDTDQNQFFFCKGEHKRPAINLEVYRVDNPLKKQVWEVFRKYHYLNTDLHSAAEQWVAVLNGKLVAHTGVIQFPLKKGWKRVHRLVVLPDYQGIGIGMKFMENIAKRYYDEGWVFNTTTTTPAMVHAMKKNPRWTLKRYGRSKSNMDNFEVAYGTGEKHFNNSSSQNRVTYSFYYTED